MASPKTFHTGPVSTFLLSIIAIALALPAPTHAQGFSSVSNRNHPEIDWRVAETDHFLIMYPAHLAGIETGAAAIAEESFRALSANLGVNPQKKMRIYLSDEDEIANGFAVPFGGGYTNIWVHSNDVATGWTGSEKWLRKVIPHELAHLFHFQAVRARPSFLAWFLGDPLPRFWTEGLAQYQTEEWDSFRGDRWLRTAVLDDELSYRDGRSAWNGRLLYAVGHSQTRYLAEQYGDSSITNILKHRKPALLGLARSHDFQTAFKKTTKKSYREFYDDWRRHVNMYYNVLASRMESTDSLGSIPLKLPGQYVYDIRFSPDTTRKAVLALTSVDRPVTRLYLVESSGRTSILADGPIRAPVAWSPDGTQLAFARRHHGANGSLLHDLYVVDTHGTERQLTYSRRATSPAFSDDGSTLAFIGSSGASSNIFVIDLASGREEQLTNFDGDTQILSLQWSAAKDRIAYARFDADGKRRIEIVDIATGSLTAQTNGDTDERNPVWSPDGTHLAFNSFVDDVPNVFVLELDSDSTRRVTRLVTGALVHDWLPPDSSYPAGRLAVSIAKTKRRDLVYLVDSRRNVPEPDLTGISPALSGWTHRTPPETIPQVTPESAASITSRYRYTPRTNLLHAVSFGLPYYNDSRDWGVFGFTSWFEPLSKHQFLLLGGLSIPSPTDESFVSAAYFNRAHRPTITTSFSHFPYDVQQYGDEFLEQRATYALVRSEWPIDLTQKPFASTRIRIGANYKFFSPRNTKDFLDEPDLPLPERGGRFVLRSTIAYKRLRPYRHNIIHPLDGTGLRASLAGGVLDAGSSRQYVRGEVSAYKIFRAIGDSRVLVRARAQAQEGESLAQDFLGFARYDQIRLELFGVQLFSVIDIERVRGFRRFSSGNRVLFGSAEYRVPVLPDLQTEILGVLKFGATTVSAFADAGAVWTGADYDRAVTQLGIGIEIKNALRVADVFEFMHAFGVAQPASDFGVNNHSEFYYRISTTLPF